MEMLAVVYLILQAYVLGLAKTYILRGTRPVTGTDGPVRGTEGAVTGTGPLLIARNPF